MQRLNLFLGYPIYSLVVTLFTLLLSSAAGSLWVQRSLDRGSFSLRRFGAGLLTSLLVVNLSCLWLLPPLAKHVVAVRIVVSSLLMALCGFPMGMLYPLGVRTASRRGLDLSWGWALNGATSAAAAVVAIAISLSYGIQALFVAGLVSYAVALVLLQRRY